jgi:hypothetical protein
MNLFSKRADLTDQLLAQSGAVRPSSRGSRTQSNARKQGSGAQEPPSNAEQPKPTRQRAKYTKPVPTKRQRGDAEYEIARESAAERRRVAATVSAQNADAATVYAATVLRNSGRQQRLAIEAMKEFATAARKHAEEAPGRKKTAMKEVAKAAKEMVAAAEAFRKKPSKKTKKAVETAQVLVSARTRMAKSRGIL